MINKVQSGSVHVNRFFRFFLVVGFLWALLAGAHGASMSSSAMAPGPHGGSATDIVTGAGAHSHVAGIQGHCQEKNGKTDKAGYGSDCCVAACSAFQVIEAASSSLAGLPVRVSGPWIEESAQGVKPESIYRPPEA